MTQMPRLNLKLCPECGAGLAAGAPVCWLCRRDLADSSEVVMAELVPDSKRVDALEIVLAISTLVIVVLMVLVGIGCFVSAPGLGVAYALFAAPPLIITLLRTQRQQAATGKVSWADRLLTLVLSTALSAGVAMLLAVAAFIAFFVWCWYMILSGG